MKQLLLNNWTLLRFIRLALGIIIIVQGVIAGSALFALAGILFTGMALFNTGCCATDNCRAGKKITVKENTHEIKYEEVV